MGRKLYLPRAVEGTMKVQEVILRSMSGRIKWFQTVEIIGDSNDGGRCRSNPSSFVAVRRTALKSTVLGLVRS